MRFAIIFLTGVILAIASTPVLACISVSPKVRSWAQCGYAAAYKTGDHKFMANFAVAKWRGDKLLSSAEPRWKKLEPKIIQACGTFKNAAEADRSRIVDGVYVPVDQFAAIADVSDLDRLVK